MKRIISSVLVLIMAFSCLCASSLHATYAATYTNKDKTLSISTSEMRRPTMLKKGEDFAIGGRIKATKTLKKIEIIVEDLDQFSTQISFSKNINSKTVNLRNYAGKVKFSKLSSGVKRLKIKLTAKDNSTVTCSRQFTILGKAKEPVHITNKCSISVNKGDSKAVTDSDDDTSWNSGKMTITLPKNRKVDGILVKWYSDRNDYTLKSYDKNNKILDDYDGNKLYFLHQYFSINENATKVVVDLKKNERSGKGIVCLRVYEKNRVGVSVERWEKPKNGECDLLVISCHRDDELLFFGGTIPYYQDVKKKNVYTIYVSGADRPRVREALAGQWSMNTKTYPTFMAFAGGYHDGIKGTLNAWGGENYCLERLVEKIRRFQPKVIVTHDVDGEYGHPSHKTVSYLVTEAVKIAGDKTKFPDSYKKYGTCKVQKVYKHYTNKNRITMSWNTHYSELYGKSPLQVATIAFDKHRSQHANWSMDCSTARKYPNNIFGLVYTRVGNDVAKNDFFENVK